MGSKPMQPAMSLRDFREKYNIGTTMKMPDLARGLGFDLPDFEVTFEKLTKAGFEIAQITAAMASRLETRQGLLLAGESGSGKTVRLKAILNEIRKKSFIRYCANPLELLEQATMEDGMDHLKTVTALGIDSLEMLDPKEKMISDAHRARILAILHEVIENRGKSGRPTYFAVATDPWGLGLDGVSDTVKSLIEAENPALSFLPRLVSNRIARYSPQFKLEGCNHWLAC